MDNNEDKIIKIFNELKNKGLIASSTKIKRIEETNFTPPIKTTFWGSTIKYTSEINKFEDDEIRFCLLHEEGHLRNRQFGLCFFLIGLLAGLIPFGYYIFFSNNNLVFEGISGVVFLFIFYLSWRFSFRSDEYKSDDFASKILKDELNEKKPSEILRRILIKLTKTFPPIFDYHPPFQQRVKKISDIYDEN